MPLHPHPATFLHFSKVKFWLFCVRRQCGLVQAFSALALLALGLCEAVLGSVGC